MNPEHTSPTSPVDPAIKTIERTYTTTVEELWRLWITKDGFQSWWAPDGFRIQVRLLEAREQGRLQYDMVAEDPELMAYLQQAGLPLAHLERCRFSVFEPLERLELKILLDFLPGVEPFENTIAVQFEPQGDSVCLTATLGPAHSEEFTRMCAETLERQLRGLDKVVAGN